jgi:bifunctional non-homologous end joining protein LigD
MDDQQADKDGVAGGGKRRPETHARVQPPRRTSELAGDSVAGVKLTHPDRVLFPEQGVTKRDLARFYESIADWILPSLEHRPLALVRCPRGSDEACFFQKHPGPAIDDRVPRLGIAQKDGSREHVYVRELPDLVALIQAGTLELHAWNSHIGDLERPDLVVFDLDPGEEAPWQLVLETARSLRDRLAELGFASFPRTTGGSGLHVVVPLVPAAGWDDIKAFARAIALLHVHDHREHSTANMSKAERRGKIFIDYLRNARGATAIASYSTRARSGAPVAVPVRWDELRTIKSSDRYGVANLLTRLGAAQADPWEDFESAREPLTRRVVRALESVNDLR